MAQESGLSFGHTADYTFIESALKARWAPFSELASELRAFVPKSIADFADYRSAELVRLQGLSPTSSEEVFCNSSTSRFGQMPIQDS